MSNGHEGVPPGVLIRDLMIFNAKLVLDGLKDLLVIKLSFLAAVGDLILGGPRRGRFFYGVMGMAERFDLWLNLHGASRRAGLNPDGLFGESRAGDDTLLGELEELVRRGPEPVQPGGPSAPLSGRRV